MRLWRLPAARHLPSRRPTWLALVALLLHFAASASADEVDDAKRAARDFFKTKSFIVKMDLEGTEKPYYVLPDGQPHPKYKMKSNGNYFRAGDRGLGIKIDGSDRIKAITVTLQKTRARIPWNYSMVAIVIDRKLTPADYDPRAIARALATFVEFEGLEVGQEIDAALDRLDAADRAAVPADGRGAAPAPVASAKPTVLSLTATATPARARSGDDVFLDLQFEVQAPAGTSVDVTSHRTLRYDGAVLPGYPVDATESLPTGSHSSRYRQRIPKSADPGTYEYRGEVCVAGDCISRTVTLVVE